MQFSGTVEIDAPRDAVWAFLMDPNQVGSCGPGVQSIDVIDEDHFKIRAKVGVGFITATFTIDAQFLEREEGRRAKIGIRGQAPGSAVDGHGEMTLRDGSDGTDHTTAMDWSALVNIHGTIASVGARLIEGTAQKLIGQTFGCIKSKLEIPGGYPRPVAAAAAAPAEEGIAATADEPEAALTADAAYDTLPGQGFEPPRTVEPEPERAPEPEREPVHAAAPEPEPVREAASERERERAAAEEREPERAAAPAVPASRRQAGRLQYLTSAVGPLGTNVYLIADPSTGDAIAVDTAHPSLAWLSAQLEARDWRLQTIVSTHGHWDHIGDNAAIQTWSAKRGQPARIAVHPADRQRLVAPQAMFAPFEIEPSTPNADLNDGETLQVGSIRFEIIHTPGHTEGSICLYLPGGNLLLSGDTVFAGGWGRVDLPGGSSAKMVESIRRLHRLPDETRVFPGHGPSTTIGRERAWMDLAIEGRLFA